MNRVGGTQSSEQRKRSVNHSYGYTINFIYYTLFNNIYFMYFFHVLYNNQSRITCFWSWNYAHLQFNINYNSILCLYIFDLPRIYSHDVGSIYLVPRIRSTDIFDPGIDLLVPPNRFRGTESHVTPASFIFQPVGIETMGPYNPSALSFIGEIGMRTSTITGDRRETTFLFQRLSVCIQRYNLVAFKGAWREEKPMADVYPLLTQRSQSGTSY